MAKASVLDSASVVEWFNELSLEEKERVLGDLDEVVRQAKAARIREIEAELAQLRSGKKKKSSATPEIAPKYRDPKDASRTWAGRGGKPNWVREHQQRGGSLDDLLIAKSANGRG